MCQSDTFDINNYLVLFLFFLSFYFLVVVIVVVVVVVVVVSCSSFVLASFSLWTYAAVWWCMHAAHSVDHSKQCIHINLQMKSELYTLHSNISAFFVHSFSLLFVHRFFFSLYFRFWPATWLDFAQIALPSTNGASILYVVPM